MDLSKLKPSERQVEILSPGAKTPVGLRVGLLHIDDPQLKKIKRQIQNEKNRLEARGKFLKAEAQDENLNEIVFSGMTGWEWYNTTGQSGDKGYDPDAMCSFNGQQPQFTRKNVMDVFEQFPSMVLQLAQEMEDDQAFFPK